MEYGKDTATNYPQILNKYTLKTDKNNWVPVCKYFSSHNCNHRLFASVYLTPLPKKNQTIKGLLFLK